MAVFHRGITLNPQTAETDRQAIRETGLLAAKALWNNKMPNPAEVRSIAAELAKSPAGTRANAFEVAVPSMY